MSAAGLLKTKVYVDLVLADEATCRRRLLDAVNQDRVRPTTAEFPGAATTQTTARTARFPGSGPEVSNLPPRNRNFAERQLCELAADRHASDASGGVVGIGLVMAPIGVLRHVTEPVRRRRRCSVLDLVPFDLWRWPPCGALQRRPARRDQRIDDRYRPAAPRDAGQPLGRRQRDRARTSGRAGGSPPRS